ncbi:PvdI(3), partial [Pseudomonas aeruginosa]
VAAGLSSAR